MRLYHLKMPRQGTWRFNPNSGGNPSPNWFGSAQKHACAAMPRSITLDVIRAWISIQVSSAVLLHRCIRGTGAARSELAACKLAGDTRGVQRHYAAVSLMALEKKAAGDM